MFNLKKIIKENFSSNSSVPDSFIGCWEGTIDSTKIIFRITKDRLITCTPGDDAKDIIFDGEEREETLTIDGVELTAVRNSRIENNQLIVTENVNTTVMDIESQTIFTGPIKFLL